jgi:hypothetical protein
MMGIMMPETCWANYINKPQLICIYLVIYSPLQNSFSYPVTVSYEFYIALNVRMSEDDELERTRKEAFVNNEYTCISLIFNNISRMNWVKSRCTWQSINGCSIIRNCRSKPWLTNQPLKCSMGLMGPHEMITSINKLWGKLSDLEHEMLFNAK